MIRPDGSQPAPQGYAGGAINGPWGLNIDGAGNVWIGNCLGRGVVLMAGAEPKAHPANVKTGDAIRVFRCGSIQCLTDPAYPISTWGGGTGFNVIYGVAAPVRPPHMGEVRKY
jgi:hypothetical protein